MGPRISSRTIITTLFLTGILGFMFLTTGCEIKASVAGTVYLNRKPMANWQVQLVGTGGNVVSSEHTNMQGHFMITNVPPGDYTVRVLNFSGAPHPSEKVYSLHVRPGRTETFDINLGSGTMPVPSM